MVDASKAVGGLWTPPADSSGLATPPPSSYRWATVTVDDPIQIRLDGDLDPLPIVPDNLAGPLLVGTRVWVQLYGRRVVILGSGGTDLQGYVQQAQSTLSGGGIRATNSTGVGWDGRFIAIGAGRGPRSAPFGYFNIEVPPDGTVIPAIGKPSVSSVTVAGGIIPMDPWDTLWYIPPLGGNYPSVPANFRIMGYLDTGAPYQAPAHWVRVVSRNGDPGVSSGYGTQAEAYMWADGRAMDYDRLPVWQNGWGNYGSPYKSGTYRRDDGWVTIEGLVSGGTVSSGTTGTVFNVPKGYRPGAQVTFPTISNSALGRVDVFANGDVRATLGSSVWLSLQPIRYRAFL